MRLRRWSLALAALAAACGGGSNDGNSQCKVSGVSVVANPASVPTGEAASLTATVTSTGTCSGGVTWSVNPTTGILTASGATATFTSSTAGSYTIKAKSNDDAAKSGSAAVQVTQAAAQCGTPNGTVVTHTANISADETWAGGGIVHSVPSSIQINAPATVTIQPCAIVALGKDVTITVRGDTTGNRTAKLFAAGTDDSNGFVAFAAADPAKLWGILYGYNEKSVIDLRHTLVQSAGSFGGQYKNAAIAMVGPGYGSLPVGMLKLDHVEIDHPVGAGVYLDANAAFTSDSTLLGVTSAPDYPILLTMMSVGSIPPFAGQDNVHDDAFVIGPNGNVFADMTIHNYLPIRIQMAGMAIEGAINDKTPVTLTLEPGVELRFVPLNVGPGAMVRFGGNGSSPNNKVGVLVAHGTATQPIVFTSGAATPAPGDWGGIWLDTAPGSVLENVIIEYAGSVNGISSANCRPQNTEDQAALIVGDFETQYVPPSTLITNSTIRYSAGYGINAMWQSAGYGPDLRSTNNFVSNAGCDQTLNSLLGACSMHGCQP